MRKNSIQFILFISTIISSFSMSGQTLSDHALFYFPFSGDAVDASGNNLNGAINGATLTTDRFGNENSAYYFDGVDDGISLPNNDLTQPDFPFSMSVWFNLESVGAFSQPIVITDNEVSNYSGALISISNQQSFSVATGDGSGRNPAGRNSYIVDTLLPLNTWGHVVAVFRSAVDVSLYYNGCELEGSYSGTGDKIVSYSSEGGSLGEYADDINGTRYFNGKLDEVGLWGKALNAQEIHELYAGIFENINGYSNVSVYDSVAVTDTLIINSLISGLNEEVVNIMKVYPNPATDVLFIESGDNYESLSGSKIQIVDVLGGVVFTQAIDSEGYSVDISDWSIGTYFYQLYDDSGSLMENRKIIIQ